MARPPVGLSGSSAAPGRRAPPSIGALLALQATVGNSVATRLVAGAPESHRGDATPDTLPPEVPRPDSQPSAHPVQRWVPWGVDPDLTVDEVIRRRDPDLIDNLAPSRRLAATESQKLRLIRLLADQRWVGSEDEGLLRELWGSFSDLPRVVGGNLGLWRRSIEGGADLDSLPVVTRWRRDFENDVKAAARRYLAANRRHVVREMQRLGVSAEGTAESMTAGQGVAVQEVQAIAADVQRALTARERLQGIIVGYDLEPDARPGIVGLISTSGQSVEEYARDLVARRGRRVVYPAGFDPFRPPHHPPFGDERPPLASYLQVKGVDDDLKRYITGYANRFPSIYALIGAGEVARVGARGASPRQAQQTIARVLRTTLTNIEQTTPKIDNGDLDWRDLRPIHDQLRRGGVPGSHPWSGGFGGWVIDDLLGDYQAQQFWIRLGLASLAAAAFVVAELATAGSATFFIAAGLAIGIPAAQAAFAWENYADLASAAAAGTSDESRLVMRGQATAEMFRASIETATALLAAFGIAGRVPAARATGPGGAAAQSAGMAIARGRVASRVAFLRQRIAQVLTQRYPRSRVVEACESQLQEIRATAVSNAGAIRSGSAPGMRGLTQVERDRLAEQLLDEVGQAWRAAHQRVRAASRAAEVEVVPLEGGGYGAPTLGTPPVRRPPSPHTGSGWENW